MAESFFPDFGLLWYLEELKKEEFWRFKELLKQEPLKFGLKPVPWSELKKASREDLAKLLNNYYADKQAWLLTRNIFLQINRRDLWEKAHEEMRITVNPYRERMKEKFRLIWEHETRLPVPENFYIDTVKVEYEVMKNLFTFKETSEDSFTIVLKGPEGIGKTTLLRRAMLEWAEGNFWKDRFPFVFFLDAREMHHAQQTSLVEFISKDWPETCEPIETIFSQPQAILFIIDGSEELTFNLTVDDKACSDWRQRHTMEAILSGLLQRMMLPTCSLMIAVDSDDVKKNVLLRHPNSIIVPAFSELERKKYFFHFFREKYKATKAFSFVRENRFLLSICQKPLLCQLICHSLKWQLERGEELHVAHLRKTSVYASFLVSVAKAVGANSSPGQSRAQLQGLCSLAAEGVWTHTYVFGHVDLRRNRLSASDVMTWVGLHLLRRNGDSVTFFHRSVQDFCAALYYLLKQPQDPHHSSIHSVAELVLRGLCRVEIRLSQMRRFLFGLSTDKMAKVLGASAGFELAQEIIRCVQSIHQRNSDVAELDFQELFYSLYETQEPEFLTQAMSIFVDITVHIEVTRDLVISAYCLPYCRNLKKMALCTENVFSDDSELEIISMESRIRFWTDLCSVFSTNVNLQMYELYNSSISDASLDVLCKEIARAPCQLEGLILRFVSGLGDGVDLFKTVLRKPSLKYLNLHGTQLSHTAVKQLCHTLKNSKCNIEKLMLGNCDIKNEACEDIFSVLICNKKLKHLTLLENSLADEGIRVLCDGLKHPNCALETLLLNYCCLSSISCDYISEVLLRSKSLTLLDLGSNILHDSGMNTLCEALKNANCRLQELWLRNCLLTPDCCKSISSVLMSNEQLRTLKLGCNDIQDVGVKQLCEGLKHPNCKLQTLGLEMCGLTNACSEDLASVLTTSKTLTVLNLDWISWDYNAVLVLCEALNHPDCGLQTLGLNKEDYDEESQLLLRATEEKNCLLTITHQPWLEDEYRLSGTIY